MRHCAHSAILARTAAAPRALAPFKEKMPVVSPSDDSAVTNGFGYGKAIKHLAINFLAAIAVVGLVVLSASLPITEPSNRKTLLGPSSAETALAKTPEFTLAELQDALRAAQANFKATQARLAETQQRVQKTAAVQSPSFSLASAESEELAAPTESTCERTSLAEPSKPQHGSGCQADKRSAP
jgi:hypothetical protein